MKDAPQPSEWAEPDIDGECRIDMPMKAQIVLDEIVIEGTSS